MTRDVYDKIYFEENYSNAMRERSVARDSANFRANATDMPNATTVVLMEDLLDGGVTITTGDFVAYFNKQHGCDRVGNMRRMLSDAQRNCELKRMKEQKAAEEKANAKSARKQKSVHRPLRPRFSFVKVVFGLMMMLAIGVLVATSALLEQTELEVAALQSEVEQMQAVQGGEIDTETNEAVIDSCAYTLDGEDQVEIYATEEEPPMMAELLSAFSELWKS